MLQQLRPDPDQFDAAYPSWIERASQLIATSGEGTTFGIFGAWGSGKTSASMALQGAVLRSLRAPLQPENSIGVAYLDCSGLRSTSPAEVSSAVRGELLHAGVVKRNLDLEKWIFTFFQKASGIAKDAMPDPLSKAGMAAVGALAETGQKIDNDRQLGLLPEIAPSIESAFIFLDDLDRCDADAAWAILRNARRVLPTTKTVCLFICDPVVLGHHISHVLGVPLAHGFQAVLKYIDIPLKIPVGYTPAHLRTIRERMGPSVSDDWHLEEVASQAVGSIPMRDILAALPQACFWLASWDENDVRPTGYGAEDKMKYIAEVVFFFALMHVCVPNAAQVVASGRRDWLKFSSSLDAISRGYTGPMKDSTESAVQHEFGAIAQEVIAGRMDLVRYGRGKSDRN
jgi:hypothetical protein